MPKRLPPRPPRAPAPADRDRWPTFVLVVVLAAASYANTLDGELFLDDRPAIVENVYVRERGPAAIFTAPSWWGIHTQITTWRPLTTLSFAINHALHGLAPHGYHIVNVALHAAVSALLLAVLARLVPWAVALVAALLFAVHPVHTEAVASVVGRAEVLAALGFFAAWWCFLAADGARPGRHPHATPTFGLLDLAGVGAFIAGMLAKEHTVMLLPVLIFADALRTPAASLGAMLRTRLPRYAALLAAAILFIVIRVRISGELTPAIPALDNPLVTLPVAARWMTGVAVVAYYALRLVFPLWLSADYTAWQITPVASPLDPRFLAGLMVLLGVGAGIAWGWRRDRPLALGLGLMTLTFALVSNLLFLIATIMAERWIYLPSAGFCLAAAALAVRPAGERPRAVPVALLALIVTLLAGRTWTRNEVWRNPMAFFRALVVTSPRSSLAHTGYGDALAAAGRSAEALAAYREALAIAPTNWRAEYNAGNVLLATGDVAGAVAAYERTLTLEPASTKAMINLGAAESRRGNATAAVAWLRRAAAHEPNVASIRTSLANVLAASGDRAGARAEFEAALALAPRSPDVLADYGVFLENENDHAAAIALLRRSLVLQPNVPERHYNLGNALAKSGALAEAVAAYQQALSLRPRFPQAMQNLGHTETLRGNPDAAREWFARAQEAGGR